MFLSLSGGVSPEDEEGFPSFPGQNQPENQIAPRSQENDWRRERAVWLTPDLRNISSVPSNQVNTTNQGNANQGGRRRRGQRGGYSQYQNNWPSTGAFSVGAPNLPPNLLALANPPPITKLSNCVNCVDNYNHYTNMGFPSKGH